MKILEDMLKRVYRPQNSEKDSDSESRVSTSTTSGKSRDLLDTAWPPLPIRNNQQKIQKTADEQRSMFQGEEAEPSELQSQRKRFKSINMDEKMICKRDKPDEMKHDMKMQNIHPRAPAAAAIDSVRTRVPSNQGNQEMQILSSKEIANNPFRTNSRIQMAEKDLLNGQKQIRDLRQNLAIEREQSMKYNAEILRLKLELGELEAVRKELAHCRVDLMACRDDLFRVQPISEIPDSEIIRDFQTINQTIIDWINVEITEREKLNSFASMQNLLRVEPHDHAAFFLKQFPDGGEYLARSLLHRFLYLAIYKQQYDFIGLSEDESTTLTAAANSMRELKPSRDAATVKAWVAEALLALSSTTSCIERRERKLNETTMNIFEAINDQLPGLFDRKGSTEKLYKSVIKPASELSLKMATSTSEYTFRPHLHEPENRYNPATKAYLDIYNLVDIVTDKTLRTDSPLKYVEEDLVGDILLPLEPSIVRLNKDEAEIILQRQTFLIKLFHPLSKRKSTTVGAARS